MPVKSSIAPELEQYRHPLADARPHPDNVRKHRLDKITKSLLTHGQRAPIVVQASTGRIVKGNGTWAAAKEIGWPDAAMVFQEMDDEEAYAFLLDDNRSSDLAGYDKAKLASGLRRLSDETGLMGTLWDDEELADLEDELEGLATLSGAATEADYAQLDPEFEAKVKERAETHRESGRLNEVPLRFSKNDYADFASSVQELRKAFGTKGTIDTVLEAVKRQRAWEQGGQNVAGEIAPLTATEMAVRSAMLDLRLLVTSISDLAFTRTVILGCIDRFIPKVEKVKAPDPEPEPLWPTDIPYEELPGLQDLGGEA